MGMYDGRVDGEKVVPREVAERYAAGDPHLRSMIDEGLPLTRNAYLFGAYGADEPEEWTHEHELQLPEIFRDPTSVKHPALKQYRDD